MADGEELIITRTLYYVIENFGHAPLWSRLGGVLGPSWRCHVLFGAFWLDPPGCHEGMLGMIKTWHTEYEYEFWLVVLVHFGWIWSSDQSRKPGPKDSAHPRWISIDWQFLDVDQQDTLDEEVPSWFTTLWTEIDSVISFSLGDAFHS